MHYPVDFTEELKRKPICGVLSVAMIAGVPFSKATEVIKKNMLSDMKRHGGGTVHLQRLGALRDLGVRFIEVSTPKMNIRRFVQEHAEVGKTYMVETATHVLTIKNGLVADQEAILPVMQHPARRLFVKTVTKVVR